MELLDDGCDNANGSGMIPPAIPPVSTELGFDTTAEELCEIMSTLCRARTAAAVPDIIGADCCTGGLADLLVVGWKLHMPLAKSATAELMEEQPLVDTARGTGAVGGEGGAGMVVD